MIFFVHLRLLLAFFGHFLLSGLFSCQLYLISLNCHPFTDDESDSSTLSSCDSAQLLRLSPKSDNDEIGAKKSAEKGQIGQKSGNPEEEEVKEIEIKIVREEDEKRDSLGSGVVLKKCLSQIDPVSAIHRSSSSSSRLSSSSRWEP